MKRLLFILPLLFPALPALPAFPMLQAFSAVEAAAAGQLPKADTVDAVKSARTEYVAAEYVGKNIFEILAQPAQGRGTVKINQPEKMRHAMSAHIAANAHKRIHGYRVRIFFDNSQTARRQSTAIAAAFRGAFPGVPVYENYVNPYFKVTVGDFRTQQEAQALADRIVGLYPTAFVVREEIHYPAH